MASDTRYLEQHGRVWRVVVPVPRSHQKAVGKTKLKLSLKTDSLKLANRLKWGAVEQLRRQIDQAVAGTASDPLIEEALAMREAASRHDNYHDELTHDHVVAMRADELRGDPIEECHSEDGPVYVYDPERERLAGTYAVIASGRETFLHAYLEVWHREAVRKERTKGDDRRAIALLERWCREQRTRSTVETITRQVAGLFIGDLPRLQSTGAQPLSNKTANKVISCLSSYWKWMRVRGHVTENVWQGQSLPEPRTDSDDRERAFVDSEILALLTGQPPAPLGDIMRIGALTGARIDAIVSLRVKDCRDGRFRFKPQKREEREREVPIHSALVALVEELTEGKGPDDGLFPQYPEPRRGYERSMPAVKAFGRYRKSVGVNEQRPGKRRSLVNFHSFRRWFITKAEQAGIPESTIAVVVGHKRHGVTFGVYSAGPAWEQLRYCIEAVRLPENDSSRPFRTGA